MANATKLYRALEQITDNEETWDQKVWAKAMTNNDRPPVAGECGTSFCLAGWAVVNDGIPLRWQSERISDGDDGRPRYRWFTDHTADGRLISVVAQEILDLNGRDMFDASNSLARLWSMAEGLTAGKIQRPDNAPKGNGTSDRDEYDNDDENDDWACECSLCVPQFSF